MLVNESSLFSYNVKCNQNKMLMYKKIFLHCWKEKLNNNTYYHFHILNDYFPKFHIFRRLFRLKPLGPLSILLFYVRKSIVWFSFKLEHVRFQWPSTRTMNLPYFLGGQPLWSKFPNFVQTILGVSLFLISKIRFHSTVCNYRHSWLTTKI